MNFQEFLDTIGMSQTTFWAILAFLASVFIDWRPEFKWNPWRSLIKWIGSNFNTRIDEKLDGVRGEIKALDIKVDYVQNELSKHITESEQKSLEDTRRDILEFCNACMNNRKHTKEQYDFMIKQCDKYTKYIKDNNIENGVIEAAIEEIKRLYKERLRKNDFLKEGEDPEEYIRKGIISDVIQEFHRLTEDCPIKNNKKDKVFVSEEKQTQRDD